MTNQGRVIWQKNPPVDGHDMRNVAGPRSRSASGKPPAKPHRAAQFVADRRRGEHGNQRDGGDRQRQNGVAVGVSGLPA